MEDTITISTADWHEMRKAQVYLACLEMAGVDNWEDGGMIFEHLEEYYPKEYELYWNT